MAGRVMRFGRSGSTMKGLVMGSEPHPYETMLWLNADGIEDSNCSCSIGSACKHVAAVALKDTLGRTMAAAKPAVVPAAALDKAIRPGAGWAHAMRGWVDEPAGSASRGKAGLILRVRPDDHAWQADSARGRLQMQLQLRPMIRYNISKRPSLTDISWKHYLGQSSYRTARTLLDDEQTWFMFQLAKALTLRDGFYAWGDAWLAVTPENARFVWDVLSRAAASGVTLHSDAKNGDIVPLNAAKAFAVKARLDDFRGGVSVRNTLWLGNEPAPQAMLFGEPAVFGAVLKPAPPASPAAGATAAAGEAADPFPQVVSLHPSAAIPKAVSNAVTTGVTVMIPAADTDSFVEKFLPKLTRVLELDNQAVGVTVPVRMAPRARVEVTGAKKNGVAVNLIWQYGNAQIPANSKDITVADETGRRISRDPDAEARILEALTNQLASYGPPHLEHVGHLVEGKRVVLAGETAAGWVTTLLPSLADVSDVDVRIDPTTPKLIEKIEPKADLTVTDDIKNPADPNQGDWFDLRINIIVDGQTVGFDQCFEAIARKQHYLFLPDGRFVSLEHPFFTRLRELIRQAAHLRDTETGNLKITRFQAGWWEELVRLGVVREQAERWKDSVDGLLNFKEIPILTQPESFKGTLRHYQAEGYSWMNFLREKNMGGVLADDMGLGKTVQTISLACRGRTPFLIVAPTSVVENWDMELERFAPHLKRTVMRSGDRSLAHKEMKGSDVIVTSYALFQRDEEHFAKVDWDTVVFDEAQFVKNHQSKSYGAIRRLKARSKFALTGTPLENNLMELWSIFSITAPGLFPPPEKFKELFVRPIERRSDPEALNTLRAQIRPFILRRLKEHVEKELPAKTEQPLMLEMSPRQKHIYDVHLQKERQNVLGLLDQGGLKTNRFKILTSLMRLRQLCLHSSLVDKKYSKVPSAKLDALVEQLETILAEDHRVIIFSQFTSFLALVKKRLDKMKWKYAYLDGATTNRKRVLDEFRDDASIPVFLISLKAGGVGLNLTSADYCILLDPWWNPAVEAQAVDRTHRIGQTRHVIVYRFIVRGTIEEKVVKLQEKKKQLFKNVLDQGDVFSNLVTEADIRKIFD